MLAILHADFILVRTLGSLILQRLNEGIHVIILHLTRIRTWDDRRSRGNAWARHGLSLALDDFFVSKRL